MPQPQRPTRERPGVADATAEVRALASKIDLLVQGFKNLEKNQEVIGRTLVAFNERLKKVEAGGGAGGSIGSMALDKLREDLEAMRGELASKTELQEVKFILEQINPLEFAKLDQVKDFVREEVARQNEGKKNKK
ncbi:hypothetical protein H0N96_03445 [Candidatus Micrarchaeota archaeon]|nr:hypothetical protein [Candidatus Micrarchaeota archaeon]